MSDSPDWHADVLEALLEMSAADVAAALPGLVGHIAESETDVDHYVIGVSFSTNHTPLDYAVDRVRTGEGDLEPVIEPASDRHAYVHFTHPPDPGFNSDALRARLVGAVDRERRGNPEESASTPLAELWDEL